MVLSASVLFLSVLLMLCGHSNNVHGVCSALFGLLTMLQCIITHGILETQPYSLSLFRPDITVMVDWA